MGRKLTLGRTGNKHKTPRVVAAAAPCPPYEPEPQRDAAKAAPTRNATRRSASRARRKAGRHVPAIKAACELIDKACELFDETRQTLSATVRRWNKALRLYKARLAWVQAAKEPATVNGAVKRLATIEKMEDDMQEADEAYAKADREHSRVREVLARAENALLVAEMASRGHAALS